MIRLALLFLVACDFSLPSQEPAPEGPLDLGAQPARERTPILPGILSNPIPAPEPGLSRSQCNELQSGGPTEGCITGEIHCGETVVGHTRGGVKVFDTAFYEAKFCTPATTEHAGGDERVYRFKMPEGKYTAVATLDTPCADLDLAAIQWGGDGCPGMAHNVPNCEMWPKDGTEREVVRMVSVNASNWLLVVEGRDDQEGAFSLTVQCRPGIY